MAPTLEQAKKRKAPIIVVVCIVATLVLISVLVATSLERLDSYEVGLKYDTVARSLGEEAQNEGLHTGAPGFLFIKFASVFQTIKFTRLNCLNKDGIPIYLNVSYQYRVRPNNLHDVVMQFKDNDTYETVLKHAGRAAIMESCSLFNTTQYQSERGIFQTDVGTKLTARYEPLHADVSDIQVNNIQRPGEYDAAVRSKETARENITVQLNGRPRLLVEAATEKEKAITNAAIAIALAESQARIIVDRANKTSESILNAYEKEAEVYATLLDVNGLGLTKEGFLSYIGIRAIEQAQNDVYVGMQGPAKTSYVTP